MINNEKVTYYQRNKAKILQKARDYYEKNKQKSLKRSRNYYEKNKEKIKEFNFTILVFELFLVKNNGSLLISMISRSINGLFFSD